MANENILEIINKEGLFQYNIFDNHSQKANEILIKEENNTFIVYSTDENNEIKGDILTFSDKNEAIDIFLKKLRELKKIYISTYVGKKYDTYYKELFNKKPHNKIYASLSWTALFFGPCWFLYRKMYIESVVIMAGSITIELILSFITGFELGEIYGRIINIILSIIGNSLYHKKIYRIIDNMKYIDNKEHIAYLSKKGGTNLVLALIIFIIILSLNIYATFF